MSWGGRQAQALLSMLLSTRPHICHGCRLPIDASLRGTRSPMRPSVEHIRPRSLGGTDHPANLALAHLSCNSSRGNRLARRPTELDPRFFSAAPQDTPPPASCSPRNA